MGGAWALGWAAAHCCKPRHGFSPPRVGPRGAPEAGERGRLLVLEARQRAAGSGRSLTLRESSGVEVGALAPVTWQRGWPARPRLGAPAAQCPGRRPRRGSSPEPGASCGPLGAADSGPGLMLELPGRATGPHSSEQLYGGVGGAQSPTFAPSALLSVWAPELECSRSTAADPAALG